MTTITIDVDEIPAITEVLEGQIEPVRGGMIMRDTGDYQTIEELADSLPPRPNVQYVHSSDISLRLSEDAPLIVFGDREIPATEPGIEAVAAYFSVPTAFISRVQPDEQEFILNHRIEREKASDVYVHFSEHGIVDVRKVSETRLEIGELVGVALEIMPEESEVITYVDTIDEFMLDVVVPDTFDRYIGGDRKVDDITKGGIRIGQDRKRNLAPWVQQLIYRLRCTNGMEIADAALRIDTRGAEEFEIISSLRGNARVALDSVSHSIEAFYDLRSQGVGDDRTGVLHRIARENDLPARTVMALEDALPGYLSADFGIDDTHEVNMFHLVNLLTNAANGTSLSVPQSRRLQVLGGNLVNDHITRCGLCHSRLN